MEGAGEKNEINERRPGPSIELLRMGGIKGITSE